MILNHRGPLKLISFSPMPEMDRSRAGKRTNISAGFPSGRSKPMGINGIARRFQTHQKASQGHFQCARLSC